ncbi:hypothetical protein CROQUDRAFT_89382 [Cronartium quercuum f. sp. fusiforme G11]|uniref:Alpha-1,6-mannosyltransferase n=1 Tax=Cronartium quercuum f. sp. fusiforme G11 TaxID=708437 RepID=A0A9P6NNS5_9BASI|nr:hypothetical protein CROQUDRAFT_89382 [Cronartium quercuum f. sp. fusiforme G11]
MKAFKKLPILPLFQLPQSSEDSAEKMKPLDIIPPSPLSAHSDQPLLTPSSASSTSKHWLLSPNKGPKGPISFLPSHLPTSSSFRRRLILIAAFLITSLNFINLYHSSFPLTVRTSCPDLVAPRLIPSSPLGPRADEAFASVGSACLPDYRDELDSFLSDAFGPAELEPTNPNSTISRMHAYLRRLSQAEETPARVMPISRVIHQTTREKGFVPGPSRLGEVVIWDPSSWQRTNPDWDYHLSADEEEEGWVRETLGENSGLIRAWEALGNEPVMRADLWRYLKLAMVGGVYADMDTRCLKPVERWMEWKGGRAGEGKWATAEGEPSVIVGIEADVGDRADWEKWWPRPIQLVQWTFATAPSHPILIDTLRRLVSALDLASPTLSRSRIFTAKTAESEADRIMRVVKATGPAPFTDAVLRYLGVITGGKFGWSSLRNVPPSGLRIGDVLVLPISGFSPGVKQMGSEEINYEGAYVHHGFAGTWKLKPSR